MVGLLLAGDVGRLELTNTVQDGDIFTILRNGQLFRTTSQALAAYIESENTTKRTVTFADSPYSVLPEDDILNVDTTGGNVVINLLPSATAQDKLLYVKLVTGAPNTVTNTPNGSDTIETASSVITTNGASETISLDGTVWRGY